MLNVIWIIVDSVRNYTCPAARLDDRGRLKVMDELAAEWVDFRTVVTSAPSTLMSMGAMFTGWPSYYIGSAFEGLTMSDSGLPTIGSCLKRHGYHCYCVTHYTWGRECWAPVFDPLPKRVWPRRLTHRREWTNAETNRALFHFLDHVFEQPLFLFIHYNCRGDPDISRHVRAGIESLRERGYFENSAILLSSDHGYPDPLRREEVARRRQELGLRADEVAHDLLMTDDNVLVPLLLTYPGSRPMRIEQQICTLDYLPTSLELAGVRISNVGTGLSAVPLLRGGDMPELQGRKVRIDGRFMAQSGRVTAIRSRSRKYVVYADRSVGEREEFYDLARDPLEIQELIRMGLKGYEGDLEEYRRAYDEDQARARQFQAETLGRKYRRQLQTLVGTNMQPFKRVLYVGTNRPEFDHMVETVLREVFHDCKVVSAREAELPGGAFDLVHAGIVSKFGNHSLFRRIGSLSATHKILIDLATNLIRFSRFQVIVVLRGLWAKRDWYLQEPMYFVSEVCDKLRGV